MSENGKKSALLRQPRLRRYAKRLLIGLVVLGALGFLALPPLVKWLLESSLSKELARPVSVASVSFNPYTLTATLRDFRIDEPLRQAPAAEDAAESAVEAAPADADQTAAPSFAFDMLRVNLELRSLLVAGLVIKEIELRAPRLNLARFADGSYSIDDLLARWTASDDAAAPAKKTAPPRFSLSNIQIVDGAVSLDDRLLGVTHKLSAINLRLPFISSLSFSEQAWVEPHFSAQVNGAPLELVGKSRPFAQSHESEFALDVDDLKLGEYFAYLPQAKRLSLNDGALSAHLKLVFSQPQAAAPELYLYGDLALNRIELAGQDGALLQLPHFALKLRRADLASLAVDVEEIALDAPQLTARLGSNGRLDWQEAFAAPAAGPTAAKAEKAAAAGKEQDASAADSAPADAEADADDAAADSGPQISVERLAIKDAGLQLIDRSQPGGASFAVSGLDLSVSNFDSRSGELAFELQGAFAAAKRVKLAQLALRDGKVALKQRRLQLGEISLRGLRVDAGLSADGELAFLPLPRFAAAEPAGQSSQGARNDPAWQFSVGELRLSDHELRFTDQRLRPAATQVARIDELSLRELSSDPAAEAKLAARLRLNKQGKLSIDGRLQPLRQQGKVKLAAQSIELLPLQPYFSEYLNVTISSGALSGRGELDFAPGGAAAAPELAYRGSLTLGNFSSVEKINAANFLRWKSLHFGQINYASAPAKLHVGKIALSDFLARAIVSADGRLNLLHLLNERASESEATATAPAESAAATAAAAPAMPISVGQITLHGGRIAFSDHFVKPNYSANLSKIEGRISGLSSQEGSLADLELRGSYNNLAPLFVTARLNPLAARRQLDLDAKVEGIELTSFSPYSGKYAGYAIDKGKLSLFLNYRLDDQKLSADNRIFLDQLTFGAPVDSPDATSLPVTLAVSLLKNRAGEIDINLPISGSLDDPEFSLGGIIVKLIVNLFVKAVTSPFALLGSMFGGGEEMAHVEFAPGEAALSAAMQERLHKLAQALNDRPGLKIEVAGRSTPESDREGLKRALLNRRVKAVRLQEMVAAGKAAASLGEVEISPEDYPRYLKLAYKAETFPKPRNAIGLVKDLPVEAMEELMLANMPADDAALRRLAERRASAVAAWLSETGGIDPARIFTLQPNLAPAANGSNGSNGSSGSSDQKGPPVAGSDSRVDFTLK